MHSMLNSLPCSLFPTTTAADVSKLLASSSAATPAQNLRELVNAGFDRIPYPGHGQTLLRWKILGMVAAHDLSLAKLYEGHTDALAILAELQAPQAEPRSLWGVWCAEPPDAKVRICQAVSGKVMLKGRKAWCSGAADLTHALVSCWDSADEPFLVSVFLRQPGVHVTDEGWHAVGMQATGSVDVEFNDAHGQIVGMPGDYVERAGFWHGAAGIAAVWHAAACEVGLHLHAQLRRASAIGGDTHLDKHRLAQLGGIDISLSTAGALLREAAQTIDQYPHENAMQLALCCRLAVEEAATQVLWFATRALGAGPLCREAKFAKMVADLPVFLRQSHAERDLASLGSRLVQRADMAWML